MVRQEIALRQSEYLSVAKRDGTTRKDTGHWTLRLAKRKDCPQEAGYGLEEKWKQYLRDGDPDVVAKARQLLADMEQTLARLQAEYAAAQERLAQAMVDEPSLAKVERDKPM